MTEKQKRDNGLLYDANYDKNLGAEMLKCKNLCHKFNALKPTQVERRKKLIEKLFGKTSAEFTVLAPFWCDYGYNIEIGNNFFANHNCIILDGAKVKFGDNVFIAPNCGFYTAGHPIDISRRNAGLEYAFPITVGNNVWIGGGVQVMPGVSIGNNVVIGGGSVVTHDIPDNVIAAGNPCKILREISEAEINKEYCFNKK